MTKGAVEEGEEQTAFTDYDGQPEHRVGGTRLPLALTSNEWNNLEIPNILQRVKCI